METQYFTRILWNVDILDKIDLLKKLNWETRKVTKLTVVEVGSGKHLNFCSLLKELNTIIAVLLSIDLLDKTDLKKGIGSETHKTLCYLPAPQLF